MNRVIDRDLGYRAIIDLLEEAGDLPTVYVGIRQEDGAEVIEGDFTMVQLGAVHEYGSRDGHVPERSYLRSTVDEHADDYGARLAKILDRAIKDAQGSPLFVRPNLVKSLSLLGERAVSDVQRKIGDPKLPPPPLAPSTIARKGSDNPLIDTGRLRASISYEVR